MKYAVLVILAGCSATDGNATFSVRESVEQLHVTHAKPGATLEVVDATNAVAATGTADDLGSFVFRKLAPASGYRVRSGGEISRHLTVMSVAGSLPSQDFYRNQHLVAGTNYIRTRDGTTLSAYITLPGPADMGPYPTVVDYSG